MREEGLGIVDLGSTLDKLPVYLVIRADRIEGAEGGRPIKQGHVAVLVVLRIL